MLRITTRDVGLTQVATVYVGNAKAIEFYTQTKHPERSIEIAEEAVAKALAMLIRSEVKVYTGPD